MSSSQGKLTRQWVDRAILFVAPGLLGSLIVFWVVYGDRRIIGAAVFVAWFHLLTAVDFPRKNSADA